MPNTTGSYPMPYPNPSAVPDVPGDILTLAQAVDDALTDEVQPVLDTVGLVWLQTLTGTGTEILIDNLPTIYTGFLVELASRGTNTATILAVLRTAAPADVTTGYDRTEVLGRNAVASSGTTATASSWTVAGIANTRHIHRLDIEGLCQAVETLVLHEGGIHADPAIQNTSNGRVSTVLTHQDATIYRGIKLTLSASQTYVCRVYGKR